RSPAARPRSCNRQPRRWPARRAQRSTAQQRQSRRQGNETSTWYFSCSSIWRSCDASDEHRSRRAKTHAPEQAFATSHEHGGLRRTRNSIVSSIACTKHHEHGIDRARHFDEVRGAFELHPNPLEKV